MAGKEYNHYQALAQILSLRARPMDMLVICVSKGKPDDYYLKS